VELVHVAGRGLRPYTQEPFLDDGALVWKGAPALPLDVSLVRSAEQPFDREGGLRLLTGNLGRAVIKTSAVKPEHRVVEAPAVVFDSQEAFLAAFNAGALDRDFVAVVRFQGPGANGMPELHSLTPSLSVLQKRGRHVALVTDGRMSGASGKAPAAIHLTPEAADGGPIARLRTGDVIRIDADRGALEVMLDPAQFAARTADPAPGVDQAGHGRDLFAHMRGLAQPAERGGGVFFP